VTRVPREIAAPAGARVRTRLRLSPQDEAVLRAVGRHLGSLAGKDLTAGSSSRWAGTITRESENGWQLADRNLTDERGTLKGRVRKIEKRIAV